MKLIENYEPSAKKIKKITDYRGKKIAFDAVLYLHKHGIAIRGKGSDLKRSDGVTTSHLHILFNNTRSILKNGILPIFVFDGKYPEIKINTIKSRKNRKLKAQQQLDKLNLISNEMTEEKIKYFKRTFSVTTKMMRDCQILLTYLGIPYVQSPGEADPQSSALAIDRSVGIYGVASEDMDHLPFGTPYLLRNFSNKKDIKEICLSKVLKELDLSHEEFIDICILMGTDYCCTIRGLGYEFAYKTYKKFRNMKKFINHIKSIKTKNGLFKYKVPENYLDNWIKAKKYYLEATVNEPRKINLDWNMPHRDVLLEYLVNENEFNKSKLSKKINEIMLIYKDSLLHKGVGKIYSPTLYKVQKKRRRKKKKN